MLDTTRYMPFIDLRTCKLYPNESSLDPQYYWKTLDVVLEEFIEHKEAKSEDGTGLLKRKHLLMDDSVIKYIGKEASNLEFSTVRGIFAEDCNEYVNNQKKVRKIIVNLTLKKASEIGIDRREFYRLKKKLENTKTIVLRNKIRKIIESYFLFQ